VLNACRNKRQKSRALVVALKKQLFTNYKAMYSESMQYIIHVSVSIYTTDLRETL